MSSLTELSGIKEDTRGKRVLWIQNKELPKSMMQTVFK
jgi:hypothetical protein